MKICHVITRMIIGGAQENTFLSARGLAARGHEVVLLTGPTQGPEGALLETMPPPDFEIREEPELIRDLHPLKDLHAYVNLRRFFRQRKFDIVHTHSSKAGIIARRAALDAGCPVILHTVHGQPFHPYQNRILNRLYIQAERFAARWSTHIFTVCQAMIDQAVEAGVAEREKYGIVYSGMDVEPYLNVEADNDLRQKLGLPPDVPVIGKVARLFELKGHDFLLEAADELVDEIPDVRFLLVGDGARRSWLEGEVKKRGLEKNFVFAGLVPPADIPGYLALMDVLVHLSLREGLPRALVQAQAASLPAVGYALDGTPEIIEHGVTGYVCPAESTSEVARCLAHLIRNPDTARDMGEKGRQRVQRRFGWQRMVTTLETAYQRFLENSV